MEASVKESIPSIASRITALLLAALLALTTAVLAQEFEGYEYNAFGEIGYGEYAPIEGYDEAAAGFPFGNLAVTTAGGEGQAVDIVLTGPDGFTRTVEANPDGEPILVEQLLAGTYSVAATDDGLQMSHAMIQVQAGQVQTLDMSLTAFQEPGEIGADFTLGEGYYGVEEELGGTYEPYGDFGVDGYEPFENDDAGGIVVLVQGFDESGSQVDLMEAGLEFAGNIVGPDDHRSEFAGSTEFNDLPPGLYSVAVTAPGHQVAQSLVQVQQGQRVMMRVALQQAEGAMMEGQEAGQEMGATTETTEGAAEEAAQETEQAAEEAAQETEQAAEEAAQETEQAAEEAAAAVSAAVSNAWSQFDIDGDDSLTRQEFGTLLYQVTDMNRDGAIDENEFNTYSDWFGVNFADLDADGDGMVSEQELLTPQNQ